MDYLEGEWAGERNDKLKRQTRQADRKLDEE